MEIAKCARLVADLVMEYTIDGDAVPPTIRLNKAMTRWYEA
jgi:hypothetical protein